MKVEIGVLDTDKITEKQWEAVDIESKREFHQLVSEHKDTVWYSVEKFVIAFNEMEINVDNTLIGWRIKE